MKGCLRLRLRTIGGDFGDEPDCGGVEAAFSSTFFRSFDYRRNSIAVLSLVCEASISSSLSSLSFMTPTPYTFFPTQLSLSPLCNKEMEMSNMANTRHMAQKSHDN